jgi:hypothetical protein
MRGSPRLLLQTSRITRCAIRRFVNVFPTTASGKVQKFMMRAAMIRELGLVVQQTA